MDDISEADARQSPIDRPPDVDAAACEYVKHGWALVPFKPGSKGPTSDDWNKRENVITDAARASKVRGSIGLCHAYSKTCALDIDDWAVAKAWLAERGADLEALWNDPDAVRLVSGRPNRGKLIYALTEPLQSKKPKGSGIELRCGTSKGTTTQDVLPPSIHPITNEPYRWEYASEVGHWQHLPELPLVLGEIWHSQLAPVTDSAANDAKLSTDPLGISHKEAEALLSRIDPDCEYDTWLGVGMSLHHEFRGGEIGFDVWNDWSSKGSKYNGRDQLEAKYAGFGQGTGRELTMRSVMAMAEVTSPDEFDAIVEENESADGTKPRFEMVLVDERIARRNILNSDYFIKDIVPRAGLGVLFGESGAGKSFITFDMCAAITRGVQWRDKRTQPAKGVYVCAEGQSGFDKRASAYKLYHNISELPGFFSIVDVPNLLKSDHARVAEQIKAKGGADLIIFDTFAQVTPGGNENSSDDVGKALNHCMALHKSTGAMVMLVHHAGKDLTKGARGWSGLKAAADVELEVQRSGREHVLIVRKMKDGAAGEAFPFALTEVLLGTDQDGDPVTSCAVDHTVSDTGHGAPLRQPTGKNDRLVLGVIDELLNLDESGSADSSAVIDTAVRGMSHDPKKRDRRRDVVVRSLAALADDGFIATDNGKITRL